MKRVKPTKYEIGPGEVIELSPEENEQIEKMTVQAEADIEAARVNFRWDKQHVEVIKAAANLIGVPYQTYIKMVLFQHAAQVLRESFHVHEAMSEYNRHDEAVASPNH